MAAGRSLIASRRRRADEEGEDEDGPVTVMVEDSQSEGSVLSEMDDDDDEMDASSLGDRSAREGAAAGEAGVGVAVKKVRKNRAKGKRKDNQQAQAPSVVSSQGQAQVQAQTSSFRAAADTEAMMNGLSIAEHQPNQEIVDFENMQSGRKGNSTGSSAPAPAIQPGPIERKTDSPAVHHRREHEEYRKKRDADPAFIPNRGNFFMHDTRNHHGAGQPPMRGAWNNNRGRGRGGPNGVGPLAAPAVQAAQIDKAAEMPWKHDLHDTINEELAPAKPVDTPQDQLESARIFPKTAPTTQQNQHAPPNKISFSSTTHAGKVLIRVYLPGMKSPVPFSEVPWKHYTRLPDHRPPLRRDKPVRVSLPGHVQRYIFPSPERSFIFIPRQMRPNQHGFGSNRYQRSIGGYGYSSRRTSMYGGSMYAASVAASRRSSFASVARENAFSPVGSFAGAMQPSRPVVRLPHGSQSHFSPATNTPLGPLSGHQTPTGMIMHSYPLPAQPQYQGTPTTTVHQPKPQKAISVTGIESPAVLQQAIPPQEAQPFANQLPAHMNDQPAFQPMPAYFSPRSSFSYPHHPQAGTPLSGIPEQALQAQNFQPMMPYAPGPYYAPYPQQQNYFYPPGPGGYPPMPMYLPPQQNYMVSPPGQSGPPPQQQATPQQPPPQPAASEQQENSQSQSGMVAHESNGMVFYMSASEAQQQNQGETYQPAESFVPSYAMPGLPPPTPAPEAPYFYPQQMPMAGYYPPQGAQQ